MRIYLAARYSRRVELCGYRDELEAIGHTVTSRWLNGSHQISDNGTPIGDDGESLVEFGETGEAARMRDRFATEDLLDIDQSDLLIAFTEPPRSGPSRGGRHVELGYALARPMEVCVVGPRENLFCWLEEVNHYETWGQLLRHLSIEQFVDRQAVSS